MKKILLVDDEEKLLKTTSKLLSYSFNIITANSAIQALNILKRMEPDCIVLDIIMPDMSGLDFLEKIRGEGNTIPVIIMTGNSHLIYAEKSANLGVSGYMNKPLDINDLITKINSIFDSPAKENIEKNNSELHPKLEKSLLFIDKHYHANINVPLVSKKIGVSYGYLATLFKNEFGMSFTCYLNRLRVRKAKKLIANTDHPLSAIMEKVGFKTEQHFFKQFKRFAGTTPNSLRRE